MWQCLLRVAPSPSKLAKIAEGVIGPQHVPNGRTRQPLEASWIVMSVRKFGEGIGLPPFLQAGARPTLSALGACCYMCPTMMYRTFNCAFCAHPYK